MYVDICNHGHVSSCTILYNPVRSCTFMDPQASSTCSHSTTKRGMDEAHPKEESITAEAGGHGHPCAICQPGELPEPIRSPTWPSSNSPFVIRRRNGALPRRAGLERCRMDELDDPHLHVQYIQKEE